MNRKYFLGLVHTISVLKCSCIQECCFPRTLWLWLYSFSSGEVVSALDCPAIVTDTASKRPLTLTLEQALEIAASFQRDSKHDFSNIRKKYRIFNHFYFLIKNICNCMLIVTQVIFLSLLFLMINLTLAFDLIKMSDFISKNI